jgi:multisubunit Na+/H+ antiporter MnhG subunit
MPTTPAPKLPRATPRLDAAALALMLLGALCFARGFAGLVRLRDGYSPSTALGAATQQFGRDERLSFLGLAVIVAGLLVGVAATVITRRRHAAMLRSDGSAVATI